MRTRRGLPATAAATELARLARPARIPALWHVVLLKAHLVLLLVNVRLRAASSFVAPGSTAKPSATHRAGSAAHCCAARARRPVVTGG